MKVTLARKTVHVVFLGLALLTGAAWVQSHLGGWRRSWSDAAGPSGGRVVAERGLFYLQTCDLAPDPRMHDIIAGMWRTAVPKDFCVGANAYGERASILLGDIAITFVRPDEATYIAYNSRYAMNSSTVDGYWAQRSREYVVAYSLLSALFLLYPGCTAVRRLVRGDRSTEVDPS